MKKSLILLAGVILSGIAFQGCKKGEGDPFISLHSRKARVVGEWTITAGKGSSKDIQVVGGVTTTTSKSWTYDGAVKTTITTVTAGTLPPSTSTSTDKYTDKYTFAKDGTFKIETTDNNTSTSKIDIIEGTWNFTGKIADNKNRSQIILNVTKYTSGGVVTTYTGNASAGGPMSIYQLKNKEMIFKDTYGDASGTDSYTSDSEWTLTQ